MNNLPLVWKHEVTSVEDQKDMHKAKTKGNSHSIIFHPDSSESEGRIHELLVNAADNTMAVA